MPIPARTLIVALLITFAPACPAAGSVGVVPVAPEPSAVTVDPATHTAYVASGLNLNGGDFNGNTVTVIDTRRCNAHAVAHCPGPWPTITVGHEPSSIAVDATTGTVYVTSVGDGTIAVIDGTRCNAEDSSGCGRTAATIPSGPGPTGTFADPANHTVYVSNFGDGTVSMLDSATCNGTHPGGCPAGALPTVAVGGNPVDVDLNPRTHTVYVGNLNGLTAFDERTCNATRQAGCAAVGQAPIPQCDSEHFGCGAFSAKVDATTNTIYESDGMTGVFVFDGRACNAASLAACATAVPGAFMPFPQPGFEASIGVLVDAALHAVYVTYQKDDALLVIDADRCNGSHLDGCAELGPREIHTGADPEAVTLDPATQTLYTANQVGNTVSVIDATRCSARTTSGCRRRAASVALPDAGSTGAAAVDAGTVYVPGRAGMSLIDSRRCTGWSPAGCGTPPTVLAGTRLFAAGADPGTHTVYVADGDAHTLLVLDEKTCNAERRSGCTPLATLTVPGGVPNDIAVNSFTHRLYVATLTSGGGPNLLSVFDGATCNAVHRTRCGQTPATVPIGDDGGPFGSTMDVAVDRLTDTVYATNVTLGKPFAGRSVYVIGGAGTLRATVDLGTTPFADAGPFGIAVLEATHTIYTANIDDGEGPGFVSAIDGAACNARDTSGCGRTPATAPAGFGAASIAADPATGQVYVANVQDTSITRIDGRRCRDGCTRTDTRPVTGDYPRSIVVDPAAATAYVGDAQGISVIRLLR